MTYRWTAGDLGNIAARPWPAPPVLEGAPPSPVRGRWLWDQWPVEDSAGGVASVDGGELWMALSAPVSADPLDRHAVARIRLLHRGPAGWRDLGPALPNGLSPGSREWSGSARLEGDRLTLHFTAAGRRGEVATSFEQRLFTTEARLERGPRLSGWTVPVETVRSDGIIYDLARQATGTVGTIKAFRDPAWFRDPAGGADYLLFTASLAGSASAFNGAIGIARRSGDDWRLLPPLVTADGVNNELERPHVVVRDGLLYLFWSTQGQVFAPGVVAPTGLYGMVAHALDGPWRLLNATGLVIGNPAAAPRQAYSWLVLDDLRVTSFIDQCPDFVGAPAPEQRLLLRGDIAVLAPAGMAVA